MSETSNEIQALLRQTQQAEPIVREFAAVWLETFRRDTLAILEYQRRDGRALAFEGEDSEPVRQQTEERLEAARVRLRDRLAHLIGWAGESGRLSVDRQDAPPEEA